MPAHRVRHGTKAGMAWHTRTGTPWCDLCRRVNRELRREQRAQKKKYRDYVRWILTNNNGTRPDLTAAELDEVVKTLRKKLEVECTCDKQRSEPSPTAGGSTTSDTPSD